MPIESPIYDPEDDIKPVSPTDKLSTYIMRSCACVGVVVALLVLGVIAICVKGYFWPSY